MRKGFDSLCGIVTSQLQMNALNGSIFIFINKKHSQVKLLLWEGDGFAVYYKRLEKGTYEIPAITFTGEGIATRNETLQHILQGITLKSISKRKRYQQPT